MTWLNPIDRMPQIRVDWANHIAQGGLYTVVMIAVLLVIEHARGVAFGPAALLMATEWACAAMTAASVGKKVVDYIKVGPPSESVQVCIGKAIVTLLWPASLLVVAWIGGAA